MTVEKVPAIYGAIANVRKEMPMLAKNGVGPSTQGGYKFLAIDDILAAVKPLEDQNDIISYLVNSEIDFHYNIAPETGKEGGRVRKESTQGFGTFTFRYVSTKDGSFVDHVVVAEGADSSDKSTRKTVTQAQKIANITLYNIITGEEDPDAVAGGNDVSEAPRQNVPAPAPAPKKETWMQKVKTDFIDTNKVSKDKAREVRDNLKAEKGNSGLTGDALYEKVYARLENLGQEIG